ncbi:UNVERIFIED_CONTAM: hypothetical protein GTU68_058804 [Idotea baltica]|nr:hypothetical protein [Idotea baltica]
MDSTVATRGGFTTACSSSLPTTPSRPPSSSSSLSPADSRLIRPSAPLSPTTTRKSGRRPGMYAQCCSVSSPS